MEDAFLRLISNQNFLIEPVWGYSKLHEILLLQRLSSDTNDAFSQEKGNSLSVDFYNEGRIVATTDGDVMKGSIAVVSMSGLMTTNDGLCSYGMKSMDKKLRSLYQNKNVAGIIMDIDTGGGYATAGDVLQNAILDKTKPVFVYTTFLCSAGIKGTLGADYIVAASSNTTIGSIGVMMNMPKLYVDESKENDIELYSDDSPKKNEAWRALKNGDQKPYIDSLTKLDENFMNDVRTFRNLKGSESYQKETLSGATFLANEAKRRGLIDNIGTLNFTLKKIQSHLKYYS